MDRTPNDVAFTPAVRAQQERRGSRQSYARWEERRGFRREITPELAAFIAARDSFYLGSASRDGQPYIQHRGGPPGFLKPLDAHTLAFADFGGPDGFRVDPAVVFVERRLRRPPIAVRPLPVRPVGGG